MGSTSEVNGPRRLEVPAERIGRWCDGFADRHGEVTWTAQVAGFTLEAADKSTAALRGWRGADGLTVPPTDLRGWAAAPSLYGVVLVRRGGYSLGLVSEGQLSAHYAGTRYVQSKTAAGGWSQQRYARRRGNQADALVAAVVGRAETMWRGQPLSGLVVGGDKLMVESVLSELPLPAAASGERREFYDIPDPRHAVLKKVVDRAHRVAVDLVETDRRD